MPDPHKNLAYSTVATAPSPATSGTSLVVGSGEGTRFPTVPFNATIWPAAGTATPANAEIIRVTAISTDTLTIVRAQEGTTARSVVVGDRIIASITAKTLSDVEQAFLRVNQSSHGFAVGDVLKHTGSTYAKAQADSTTNAEVIGVVCEVPGTNDFVLQGNGRITGLSSLTAGTTYFLSPTTAGAITATEPTIAGHVSKPVLLADATTSGWITNMRGYIVGSAGAWITSFYEDGSSLTNWTQDSGSWSVAGGGLQVNTTGGSIARLKYNTAQSAYQGGVWLYQAEINMSSTSIGSDAPAGLLFYWDGAGSGDPAIQLFKAGAGAGTKRIRGEQDQTAARLDAFTPSPTWATDAWHKLTIVSWGTSVSVLLDGVQVAATSGDIGPGVGQSNRGVYGHTAAQFVGLVCNNATVTFRNITLRYQGLS